MKKPLKFEAGNVTRTLKSVLVTDKDLVEIDASQLSDKTRTNLKKLKNLYHIKWKKIIRYPVHRPAKTITTRGGVQDLPEQNVFGYIIYGELHPDHKVTYIRREVAGRGAGSTDLWFSDGYKLPAAKIIQAHEKKSDICDVEWGRGRYYDKDIAEWERITQDKIVGASYIIHHIERNKTLYNADKVMDFITEIARRLDKDDLMKLLTKLQKIQFERL